MEKTLWLLYFLFLFFIFLLVSRESWKNTTRNIKVSQEQNLILLSSSWVSQNRTKEHSFSPPHRPWKLRKVRRWLKRNVLQKRSENLKVDTKNCDDDDIKEFPVIFLILLLHFFFVGMKIIIVIWLFASPKKIHNKICRHCIAASRVI